MNRKRQSKRPKVFDRQSALNLGFFSRELNSCANIIELCAEPLQLVACSIPVSISLYDCPGRSVETESICNLLAFLPDFGDHDEEDTPASNAMDRWFQNRFNDWLKHVNHEPSCPNVYEYDWQMLGDNLLPFFFKVQLK